MNELVKESPSLMVNIAASPFDFNHEDERKKRNYPESIIKKTKTIESID
jgi:hypothetical protein